MRQQRRRIRRCAALALCVSGCVAVWLRGCGAVSPVNCMGGEMVFLCVLFSDHTLFPPSPCVDVYLRVCLCGAERAAGGRDLHAEPDQTLRCCSLASVRPSVSLVFVGFPGAKCHTALRTDRSSHQ
jgi:hypothetical protein